MGSLTMTYFHAGNPHYHRRDFVSRSCSGWEGVGPKHYGRQTVKVLSRDSSDVLSGQETKEGRQLITVVITQLHDVLRLPKQCRCSTYLML